MPRMDALCQTDKDATGMKLAKIGLRVPQALKEAAEHAANKDRRSLSSFVQIAMEKYLRDQGYPV